MVVRAVCTDATPEQQAAVAADILRKNPSGSDWGAGLAGRENAQALLKGLGTPSTPGAPSAAGGVNAGTPAAPPGRYAQRSTPNTVKARPPAPILTVRCCPIPRNSRVT